MKISSSSEDSENSERKAAEKLSERRATGWLNGPRRKEVGRRCRSVGDIEGDVSVSRPLSYHLEDSEVKTDMKRVK